MLIEEIKSTNIIYDAHVCPPLAADKDLSSLIRYKDSGVNFVSVNAGYGNMRPEEIVLRLKRFRNFITVNTTNYSLVKNFSDIEQCKQANRLAISFDLEGACSLDGKLDLLDEYKQLGVNQLLLAYNKNSAAAGGCLDIDFGLTAFGRDVIKHMNNIGMLIDCSHTGKKSSFDIMETSMQPVVFSHSNPAALCNHQRNITDDQIKACAETGGVIGINGLNIFLGCDYPTVTKLVDHIDYVAQLVGFNHVGVGLDFVIDHDEAKEHAKKNPDIFLPAQQMNAVELLSPENFPAIGTELFNRGYKNEHVDAILGGNFMRVIKQVWIDVY